MCQFSFQHRLVNRSAINEFVYGKRIAIPATCKKDLVAVFKLFAKLHLHFGWSVKVAESVIQAYREFIELKLVLKDYDNVSILPSWAVDQLWKWHVNDEDKYKSSSEKLFKYEIIYPKDLNLSDVEKEKLIEQTKKIYLLRFNRPPIGNVWNFDFTENWWKEYDPKRKSLGCHVKNKSGDVMPLKSCRMCKKALKPSKHQISVKSIEGKQSSAGSFNQIDPSKGELVGSNELPIEPEIEVIIEHAESVESKGNENKETLDGAVEIPCKTKRKRKNYTPLRSIILTRSAMKRSKVSCD